MRKRRDLGFTLIELLVVIAIIAILAAILFPVFTAARESGRRAACTSNLKQIAQALQTYRDDYGGKNPHIWGGGRNGMGDSNDRSSFWFVITRYVGQKIERNEAYDPTNSGAENKKRYTVYKCQAAPWLAQRFAKDSTAPERGADGLGRTNFGFAYTMNETGWRVTNGYNAHGQRFVGWGITDAEVAATSKMIFVAEGMGWQEYGVAYQDGRTIDNERPTGSSSSGDGWTSNWPNANLDIPLSEADRLGTHHGSRSRIYNIRVSHGMGAMCLFYDGHVEQRIKTKGYNWTPKPLYDAPMPP